MREIKILYKRFIRWKRLKVERIFGIVVFGRVGTFHKIKQILLTFVFWTLIHIWESPSSWIFHFATCLNQKPCENLDHTGLHSLSSDTQGFSLFDSVLELHPLHFLGEMPPHGHPWEPVFKWIFSPVCI